MIKQLKKLTLQFFAGANITIVLLMLLVGYSDHIDPEHHPIAGCVGITFPFFIIANFLFLGFWMLFYWRKAWIPILGFILAYEPINIYMPIRLIDDPPADALKVMAYNVCGFGGRGTKVKDTFGNIFGYIIDNKPDILCIVEDNDTWRHSDTLFAKHFDYNERVTLTAKDKKWINHIGMHTRFPILKQEIIEVESGTKVNGAVAFYLQVDGDTLLVVGCHLENIHLDTADRKQYKEILKGEIKGDTAKAESKDMLEKLSEAFAIRAKQAKAIKHYVDQNSKDKPVIICGDFNDTPISFVRHTLSKGLTDCYAASGRGLGLSYNQKGFNFRIDHILCSPDITPYHCVVDTKIADSDHYPVVCWLKMREKP